MVQKTFSRGIDVRDEIMVDGVAVPDGHAIVGSNGDGTPATAPVSGAPSGLDTSKALTITSPADWSGPSSGFYSASIAQADHGLGSNTYVAEVFTAAGVRVYLGVDGDGAGNFTLTVSATPDERETLTVIIRTYQV